MMRAKLESLKIKNRLLLGFSIIIILLFFSISFALLELSSAKKTTARIVELRVPTALTSSNMSRNIYASLAALRGWMLTGDINFKVKREKVWTEITKLENILNHLSENWTNPDNIEKWKKFVITLDEFKLAQTNVENMAYSEDELPATKILINDAAPRAAKMFQLITKVIELEVSGKGTKNNKNRMIISLMADVRSTLAASLAGIRAYLLTGKLQFKNEFTEQWIKNEKRFSRLLAFRSQLSQRQNALLTKFKLLRDEFSFLPLKMFDIRESKKWNMSTYLLVTQAVPRAEELLKLLVGSPIDANLEGMVDNQRMLLESDSYYQVEKINKLLYLLTALLFIGVGLGVFISYLISRSIANPIELMTTAMGHLAGGKLDISIPALEREDEVGGMAAAVQVFKENAIERDRIEKEKNKTMRELDFQKLALDEHAIVSVTNINGDIIYANDKFCKISGFPLNELIGKNHRILKSGEHSSKFYENLWNTVTSGEVWHGEIKNLKKDGGYYWVQATIVPFLDENNKPFQYVAIRTDVTKIREAEETLRRTQKMDAVGQLSGGIAHDI